MAELNANLNVSGTLFAPVGVFSQQLTVSGVPVAVVGAQGSAIVTRGGVWISPGGTEIIATGAPEIFIFVPTELTIQSVNVVTAGGPGSCSIDVRKKALASGFPPAGPDSITNGNPIVLNNQTFSSSINISPWSNFIEQGSIASLKLLSTSNFTTIQVNITLQ